MQNEEPLMRSRELLEKLFRGNPTAVGLVRLEDGVMLDVNEAYERLFGWARHEVIGRSTSELRIWADSEARARFREDIAAKGRVVDFQSRARRKSGELFDSLLSSEIIEQSGERIALVIVVDVTDRKRAEVALRQSEQRYRQLSEELERKVAARTADLDAANRELEAFSYSVSHDLRAPLRHVEGFAKLLQERHAAGLAEEAHGYLGRMREAAGRMDKLIQDLLEFSRVSRAPLGRRDIDLSALAKAVAAEVSGTAADRVVEWRIAEGLRAHADPGLMRIVMENLLGNAWKYSRGTPNAVIELGATPAGEFLVRDNGAGFDAAQAGSLFQPFRRLHGAEEFEGSGVGLATVKRIIERHDGRVRAEGSLGAGAVFYFTLPPGAAEPRR
jgi:PAS domain S-box-containing protein